MELFFVYQEFIISSNYYINGYFEFVYFIGKNEMGKLNIYYLMCCQKLRIRKCFWEKMDLMLFVG